MTAPKKPNSPKLRINKPAGMPAVPVTVGSLNEGNSRGGGGVNVGRRVGVCCPIKAASKVGSIVGVEMGVGVGGISINGRKAPGDSFTYRPYTHPMDPGTPG